MHASAMHMLITQHISTSVHIVSRQHGVSASTKSASAIFKQLQTKLQQLGLQEVLHKVATWFGWVWSSILVA